MDKVIKTKFETPYDKFLSKTKDLLSKAKAKGILPGGILDEDYNFEFNEFKWADRKLVSDLVTKALELDEKDNVWEELRKIETQKTIPEVDNANLIELITLIVIQASFELKVSRYSILEAVKDNIIGNY